MANPLNLIETDNGDHDLNTSAATVFSLTNSAIDRLIALDIQVGDGVKDLTADAETTLTLQLTQGGIAGQQLTVTVPNAQDRARVQTMDLIVLASEVISMTMLSDNTGDTDVDVTVRAYDVTPLQPTEPGRAVKIAADGDVERVDVTTANSDMRGTDSASTAAKLLKYVQLLFRKDAAIATDNATELTEINADGGSGSGTADNTTDSVEAIRDTGDVDWITGSGGTTTNYFHSLSAAEQKVISNFPVIQAYYNSPKTITMTVTSDIDISSYVDDTWEFAVEDNATDRNAVFTIEDADITVSLISAYSVQFAITVAYTDHATAQNALYYLRKVITAQEKEVIGSNRYLIK